ncbi:MAG: chemotaxis protein CheW [Chromatiales bacterium]|nr:chemotaxis protein CheW [Chromatiales bacterium]MDX9766119.1 chemotaxis protein CheW [Ectothiorhodospiraceae bacterium]
MTDIDEVTPQGSAFERLPAEAEARRILAERLDALARVEDEAPQEGEPMILFRLGREERYAVPLVRCEEIVPDAAITPVPCTPRFIAGVINRRGEVLTVLDPAAFFQVEAAAMAGNDVLVVRAAGQTVGLRVDEVLGRLGVDMRALAPAIPSVGVSNLAWVRGIHGGNTTVIDVDAMLADPAILVDERTA